MSKRLVPLLAAIAVLPAAAWITPALARRVAASHGTVKVERIAGSAAAAGDTRTRVPLGELPRVLIGNTPQGAAINPTTSTVYTLPTRTATRSRSSTYAAATPTTRPGVDRRR
jgi:hypothetical protein